MRPISRFLFTAELPQLIEETRTVFWSITSPLLWSLVTLSSSPITIAETSSPSLEFHTSLNVSTTSCTSWSRYAPLMINRTATPSSADCRSAVKIGLSPHPHDQSMSRYCKESKSSSSALPINSTNPSMQLSGQVNNSPLTLVVMAVDRGPSTASAVGMIHPFGSSDADAVEMCCRNGSSSKAICWRTMPASSTFSIRTPQSTFPRTPGAGIEGAFQFPEEIHTLVPSRTATLLWM